MLLRRTTHTIANPFSTKTNKFFPQTIKLCFDWAEYMHDRFPVIGRAINKVVRYFAADISVNTLKSPSLTDTDKLLHTRKLIVLNYEALQLIIKIGELLATMGNVFVYAMPVISRTLCCTTKDCNFSVSINNLKPLLDYLWDGTFKCSCPKCGKHVIFNVIDKISTDIKGRKTIFRCYSARDVELKYNLLTDEYTYLYKMPSHIKLAIISGDPVYLRSTPQVFLKAAFTGDYILFPKDRFLHLRTDSLSSMDRFYKGWGTPLFLNSFNNILRLAYLDKFNEAVATDFIAPIRMISPPAQNLMAGQDGLRQPISGHAVKNFIFLIVKGIRLNPSQWVVSPFPLQYQMLGGLAKQLAPVLLMRWYEERILLDMSIPVLLRQTTFQSVAPSMGLRMFLRQWIHFTKNLLFALMWVCDIICDTHLLDRIKVNLDKTSFVLDTMHKQTILNMAGSGLISNDTVLKTVGLDFKELQYKKMQEDQDMAEEAMKAQNSQQQIEMTASVIPPPGSVGIGAAQFNIEQVQAANMPQGPSAMPPPGAPIPPGTPAEAGMPMPFNTSNSRSVVMEQLFQEAQSKAQEIADVGRTQGAGVRRSMLVKLKAQNPELHAQVKAILLQMDQDVASQAIAQSRMP